MSNRPPPSGCSIAASNNSSGGSPLRSPPSSPSLPQPFAIVQLAAAIRSNSDRIAAAERRTTGQSELATRHQCDLALRFIAHYAAHTAGDHMQTLAYVVGGSAAEAAAIAAHEPFRVDGTSRRSLFEVLTGLAMHFRVGHAVTVRLDAARSYLKVGWHTYCVCFDTKKYLRRHTVPLCNRTPPFWATAAASRTTTTVTTTMCRARPPRSAPPRSCSTRATQPPPLPN